jgi:hypothetical protein
MWLSGSVTLDVHEDTKDIKQNHLINCTLCLYVDGFLCRQDTLVTLESILLISLALCDGRHSVYLHWMILLPKF